MSFICCSLSSILLRWCFPTGMKMFDITSSKFNTFLLKCTDLFTLLMMLFVIKSKDRIQSRDSTSLLPLQVSQWTPACARRRLPQSRWPARFLAPGTACSVTGRRGPPALRPALARTWRGSRCGRAPSWPTTPVKVRWCARTCLSSSSAVGWPVRDRFISAARQLDALLSISSVISRRGLKLSFSSSDHLDLPAFLKMSACLIRGFSLSRSLLTVTAMVVAWITVMEGNTSG